MLQGGSTRLDLTTPTTSARRIEQMNNQTPQNDERMQMMITHTHT